jgi:hypothetical protein
MEGCRMYNENGSIEASKSCYDNTLTLSNAGVVLIDTCKRIIKVNDTISNLLKKDKGRFHGQKLGNGLNCLHSDAPGGCGNSKFCFDCKLRNAIEEVLTNEIDIKARPLSFEFRSKKQTKKIDFRLNSSLVNFKNAPHIILIISKIRDVPQEC